VSYTDEYGIFCAVLIFVVRTRPLVPLWCAVLPFYNVFSGTLNPTHSPLPFCSGFQHKYPS